MTSSHRCSLLAAILGVACGLPSAHSAPLSPIVDLNGDSVSNYLIGTGSDAGRIKVWYDSAHNGTSATQQDYGNNAAANMPSILLDFEMPNYAMTGIKYNIVDFSRNTTGSLTSTPGSGSDWLESKLGTNARTTDFSSTFTSGADAAYNTASGSVSWFTVFRTNHIAGPATGTGSGTAARQSVFRVSTAASTAQWGTAFQDDYFGEGPNNVPVPADDDLLLELGTNARSTEVTGNNKINNAGNASAGAWYIVGSTWNTTSGAFSTMVIQQDGSTILDITNSANVDGAVGPHALSALGRLITATTTSTTSINSLQGQIAEHLVYDSALSRSDMEDVMNYLNRKYFVPEPSSLCLLAFGLVFGAAYLRRVK